MGNKKNRGRDYTPTSDTRDWAKRFLLAWEESGGSFPSYRKFCQVQDWNYHKCRRLRSLWDDFRDAMDNIAARFSIEDQTATPINTAAEHFPAVTEDRKRMWLEKWRLTKNRMEACKFVSKTWKQVQQWMEDDPDFRAAYEEIDAELQLAVKDAQLRAALDGHNSAMNAILKPERESSDDGVNVTKSSGARKKWSEIYGRHHGSVEATG